MLTAENEIDRQFRCLDQMISMHSTLRDRYAHLALTANLLLLASSVVFCATTFSGDYISARMGLSTRVLSDILGVASVTAFFASLAMLTLDCKGTSARHADAAKRLTAVLALFRQARHDSGWPEDQREKLHQAYWGAMTNIAPIPDSKFNSLKAHHLRKVQTSKMSGSFPGCPLFIIRAMVLCRSVSRAVRGRDVTGKENQHDAAPPPDRNRG